MEFVSKKCCGKIIAQAPNLVAWEKPPKSNQDLAAPKKLSLKDLFRGRRIFDYTSFMAVLYHVYCKLRWP